MAAPLTAARRPWLYGPAWDLLLGCGGLYLLVFALLWMTGPPIMAVLHQGILPLVILVSSVPHYGATLLRVYERRADRRAYWLFSAWVTIAIWAWFVAGIYNLAIGTWLVTLYLTWSPWHYSGQNYGIGLMLMGRAGVAVPPPAKRLLWASFLLSWGLVVLSVHSAAPGASYAPTPASLSESAYVFAPLGIPIEWVMPALAVLFFSYLTSLFGAFALLRRQAPWRDLLPLIVIVALQAFWFSIPVISRAVRLFDGALPLGSRYQTYMLMWIALGHALQYLWVTTYFATAVQSRRRVGLYWVKAFLAGAAVFGVPVFLFSPDLLGVHAFEAGLGILVAAAVNVHHFVLDGAIWKLRDGRIARILLRPRTEQSTAGPPAVGPRPWVRPLVWMGVGAAGLAYAAFSAVGTLEMEYGFRRALDPPDPGRLRLAAARLAAVGHDHPTLHLNLGILAERAGDLETARREAERSLELGPSKEAWMLVGRMHQRGARWSEAASAYEAALGLDPAYVPALSQLAGARARTGDLVRAEQALARASQLAPDRPQLGQRLEQVRRLRARESSPSVPPGAPGS